MRHDMINLIACSAFAGHAAALGEIKWVVMCGILAVSLVIADALRASWPRGAPR